MTVIGVVAALVLGAFVVGQQFWELSGSASTPLVPLSHLAIQNRQSQIRQQRLNQRRHWTLQQRFLQRVFKRPPRPMTERTQSLRRRQRKNGDSKKAKKLPNTVTDDVLASQLKKTASHWHLASRAQSPPKSCRPGRHVITLAYDICPMDALEAHPWLVPAYLQGGALSRCVESTLASWRYPKPLRAVKFGARNSPSEPVLPKLDQL